jgi:hypothetical protein
MTTAIKGNDTSTFGGAIAANNVGAGNILQVVSVTTTAYNNTTGTTYIDSGLTLSIIPSSSSNKILSMSTVKSKKLQVGTDATSSNNFTIYQPATPDGTLRIGVGNADSPTEVGSRILFINISIKPTASGSTIEQDGSTVLSVESDRSVDIDSGTLHVDATNNRVGIGTSSPATTLTVTGSYANGIEIYKNGVDSTSSARLFFNSDTNTTAVYNANGNFIISTGATVGSSSGTERMRIDSSGNVLVAGTSFNANGSVCIGPIGTAVNGCTAVSASSSVTNMWRFYNPNGNVGTISTSGSATSYVTSSDYRLKENILPMIGALNKVLQLKPCTYTWKSDSSNGQGFIAHELAEIVPDAVVGKKDAVDEKGNPIHQGVDTSFLVATLTAAIQEQQDIIKALETRIQALEAK